MRTKNSGGSSALIIVRGCFTYTNARGAREWLDDAKHILSGAGMVCSAHHRAGGQCKAQCITMIVKIENDFSRRHLEPPIAA